MNKTDSIIAMRICLCLIILSSSFLSLASTGNENKASSFIKNTRWAFEENKGQVTGQDSSQVKFFYKQKGISMFILNTGIAYQFEKIWYPDGLKHLSKFTSIEDQKLNHELSSQIRTETYRMDIEWIGANPHPEIITEGKSVDFIQYYNRNVLDVHSYEKITFKNIYPHIDWVMYLPDHSSSSYQGKDREEVKYDFVVHPGGDPSNIKLKTKWADRTRIDTIGNLILESKMGHIIDNAPVCFQDRNFVPSKYRLNDNVITFDVSKYDPSKTLTIDPNIIWSTYYGGSQTEWGFSCIADKFGNIFLTGDTYGSTTNIASGGFQSSFGGNTDAFLVKFNSSGTRLWATYYGGSNNDISNSCAVDQSGNVLISGYTNSSSNIASSGHQNSLAGDYDGFIVKFNSTGSRLWASYYGGTNTDYGYSCATDLSGNVFFSGLTNGGSGISSGGHQNTIGGYSDAFLVKFNSSGTRLWGTFYGGTGGESGYSCTSDKNGNVYLSGKTSSPNNISLNGFKNNYAFISSLFSYNEDAFLVKFNSSGSRLWATYYGGIKDDIAYSCIADDYGNVFLSGETSSDTGISFNGFQNARDSLLDAFIVKFNSSGTRLWASYYGGKGDEEESVCTLDSFGNIFLAGTTYSNNNIGYNGYQNTINGTNDPYFVKFNSSGSRLWGSYYNLSSALEFCSSISLDMYGNIYLAGMVNYSTVSASSGHQNTHGGSGDAFLVKFKDNPFIKIEKNLSDTICLGDTISFISLIQNGGSLPKFKWYKNNILIDTNSSFSTSILSHGDSLKCLLKSNLTGLFVDSAWSNTLRIYFYPLSSKTIFDTICYSDSLLFNGKYCSLAGLYYDTLVNNKNCDSFLTLDLFIHPISQDTIHDTVCYNGFKFFNGSNRFNTGFYYDTLIDSKGCDSFLTLRLYVRPIIQDTIFDTICANQSKFFNGINQTVAGIYYDTLLNSIGCDSFIRFELFVKPINSIIIYDTICSGSSIFFNGLNRFAAGTYLDTLSNSKGCDSFLTLNLFVKSFVIANIFDTTCSNQPYFFNGLNRFSSGQYRDTFMSSSGCDSFIFLNLTVNQTSTTPLTISTTCSSPSYFFKGLNRTTTGIYRDTLKNILGCDSFVILDLTIKSHSSSSLTKSICPGQSYLFDGVQRTTSGTYTRTIPNASGCDSMITLTLTVLTNPSTQFNTVWGCTPFVFNGKTYFANAVVKDTIKSSFGCDSVVISTNLNLKPSPTTLPPIEYIFCDSVIYKDQKYTTSFTIIDTFRTSANIVCDSIYQPIKYTIKHTPQVTISPRQIDTLYKGESRVFIAKSAKNYLWSTGETSSQITVPVTQTQAIFLTVWDDMECRDTLAIYLTALDPTILDIPTGFSPLGTHLENRTFRPNINGRVERILFDVYNRLGEKVYSSSDSYMTGWDGRYKGENAPAGAYSYILEYQTNKRIYFKSGEVELVR